jgi:hypothetical protein
MDIIDLRETFKKWLLFPEYSVVDVVMGCIAANIMPGEAVNMYIVAPAGTGKTEVIRALEGFDRVAPISHMTPKTLLSGFGGGTAGGKKGSASLLKQLIEQNKLLITMKDFTSVLSMRSEDRNTVMGQIREIADGKYDAYFGNFDKTNWEGKLAFIAGVTSIIDQYHDVSQKLGERFLYYRLPRSPDLAVAKFSQENSGMEETMRVELAGAVKRAVAMINRNGKEGMQFDDGFNERVHSMAVVVSKARSQSNQDRYTKAYTYIPEAEGPSRLSKQFTQLCAGIAVVNGQDFVDGKIYEILKKVAWDTIPSVKARVVRYMLKNQAHGNNLVTVQQVSSGCNLPVSTIRQTMEDFEVMDVMRKRLAEGTTAYLWGMQDEFYQNCKKSEL